MQGIKEISEVFDAVESLSVDAIVALKDGADLSDLSVIMNNLGKIKDAIEGFGNVDDEVKDLDQEETKLLAEKAVSMAFNIYGALKA